MFRDYLKRFVFLGVGVVLRVLFVLVVFVYVLVVGLFMFQGGALLVRYFPGFWLFVVYG